MLIKNYDGWDEVSELDENSLSKQLDGWSSFSRDKKIGIFMSLLRHNKYNRESETSLNQLKTHLEREREHHLRYLSHINGIFNKKDTINLDAEHDISKEFLVGKIFQTNGEDEEIKIVSVPRELKYISKLAIDALTNNDSDSIIQDTTSNHFVENPDYETDSDDPTSGPKTPRSLPSPGPAAAPKRPAPRVETGNAVRSNTDSRETRVNNRPIKYAERYQQAPPKIQQISLAESLRVVSAQKEREDKAKEEERQQKLLKKQREQEIEKSSKKNDKEIKKNGGLITKVISKRTENIPRTIEKVTNGNPRKNNIQHETIKLYSEIIFEPPLEEEDIVILSSSEPENVDHNSSDLEFEDSLNGDPPKAKRPKCSKPNKGHIFQSGYPENGDEKATTTLQILASSLTVNPSDLNLIMNCLKGLYIKPNHITRDYYMVVIDEEENIINKKVGYWITGFEIYFNDFDGPRWDLISYNQLDL